MEPTAPMVILNLLILFPSEDTFLDHIFVTNWQVEYRITIYVYLEKNYFKCENQNFPLLSYPIAMTLLQMFVFKFFLINF